MFTFERIVVILAFLGFCSLSPALAVPDNGDFSIPGLAYWTVDSGFVSDGGGYALFEEETHGITSLMWQDFTLASDTQQLSFHLIMESLVVGPPTTDVFSVSLLDYTDNTSTQLYALNNDAAFGDYWQFEDTVNLNISSFAGRPVRLSFGLLSDAGDGYSTRVSLSDVYVTGTLIVPAPAALGLCAIGAGLVALLRRLKTIQ